MTYCVGILVEAGLVLIADTRTNAGVDNISMFKKLHVLCETPERQIYCASAGSLSVTQSMLSMLEEGLPPEEVGGQPRTIARQATMFRVAQLVGEALHDARAKVAAAVAGSNIVPSGSLLVGGRIGDQPPALFQIYSEGNFIECQPDAPFLQVGERKYGKPILDRALRWDTALSHCVKLALLSFDSTIRSNLSVARPLDLVVLENGQPDPIHRRIEEDDPYFDQLSVQWSHLLAEATDRIDDPPFMHPGAAKEVPPEIKPVADKVAPVPDKVP
jgi:putative proteasome-type protease